MNCSAPIALLCATLPLANAGCRSARPSVLAASDYPGTLRPPGALATQAVWQQRVTATWSDPDGNEQTRGFGAAVQRRGDSLTVVGLSPMGSVGFSIEQSPNGVEIENNIPEQMVLPPRFILLDVQRTFYPWIDATEVDAAGDRVIVRDGEQVLERWQDGRLTERSFTRNAGGPKGVIRIRYEWGRDDWTFPTLATLDNGRVGDRLQIVTHNETRIPQEAQP